MSHPPDNLKAHEQTQLEERIPNAGSGAAGVPCECSVNKKKKWWATPWRCTSSQVGSGGSLSAGANSTSFTAATALQQNWSQITGALLLALQRVHCVLFISLFLLEESGGKQSQASLKCGRLDSEGSWAGRPNGARSHQLLPEAADQKLFICMLCSPVCQMCVAVKIVQPDDVVFGNHVCYLNGSSGKHSWPHIMIGFWSASSDKPHIKLRSSYLGSAV